MDRHRLSLPRPASLALAATVSILALADASGAPREARDRPNLIVVFLDDSGYGDYCFTGNPVIETPNLARVAREGANFTQFYVTSPACSASRYSLLTGRYPGRSGFPGWVVGPHLPNHLDPGETTLADGLRARGYATAMFGKWHLGVPHPDNGMTPDALPLAHGFDEWIGTDVSHDYDVAKLLRSDPDGEDPAPGYLTLARDLPSDSEASTSLTGLCTEGALRFVREQAERPFFIYLAYNQPHLGLYAAEEFEGTSRRGLLGDVMAEIDHGVGEILAALEEEGIAENTLLVFTSDNGPWIRFQDTEKHPKYGEARLHVGYAHPFRDGKGSNWEGGHRVPGLFHWPGTIPPGRRLEPASTLDLLPTAFALAGAPLPEGRAIDGRDIRPLLLEPPGEAGMPPFVFAYSDAANRPVALRSGPWKIHLAIRSQTGESYGFEASRESPLLFHLEHDLGERIDRAAERPEIVERLLSELDAVAASVERE